MFTSWDFPADWWLLVGFTFLKYWGEKTTMTFIEHKTIKTKSSHRRFLELKEWVFYSTSFWLQTMELLNKTGSNSWKCHAVMSQLAKVSRCWPQLSRRRNDLECCHFSTIMNIWRNAMRSPHPLKPMVKWKTICSNLWLAKHKLQ